MYQQIEKIGAKSIVAVEEVGRLFKFLLLTIKAIFSRPFGMKDLIRQLAFIGSYSVTIILFSGLFTGMVLALLFYDVLSRYGSVDILGSAVALSLIKELGPVMSALMVIARVGSSTTAEIAIMRSEQQFDALQCMAINPYRYVMVPKFIAAMISIPLLTAIFNVVGIFGGYLVGGLIKGIGGTVYIQNIIDTVVWTDLKMSFIKSFLFALIVIWVALGKGFYVHMEKGVFGAEAVSRVTTKAVVTSAIAVLFIDFLANSFLI